MATAVFGIDYETAQRALQIATLACAVCAGSVVAAVVAYDLFGPLLRAFSRLWRRSRVECVAAAAVLGFVVAWGGSKGTITFPRTNAEYELLKDAGSFILTAGETNEYEKAGFTNDLVAAIFTTHPLVPDTADVQMWRRQIASTNDADWAFVGSTTVAQSFLGNANVFSYTFPAYTATNWDWVVFTTWQPAPAVQTNGVLHVNWAADPAEQGADALRATPKLSAAEVDGVRLWPFEGSPLPEVPTPDYYVQDGLVAMWDGEWNAGRGIHDSAATVWKDLVGSRNLTMLDMTTSSRCWEKNCAYTDHGNLTQYSSWSAIAEARAIECVYMPTEYGASYAGVLVMNNAISATTEAQGYVVNILTRFHSYKAADGLQVAYDKFAYFDTKSVFNTIYTYTAQYSTVYRNAVGFEVQTMSGDSWNGDTVSIAARGDVMTYNSPGRFYCIRIYNRELTAAEVAHNYAVDLKRFGADGERHDD